MVATWATKHSVRSLQTQHSATCRTGCITGTQQSAALSTQAATLGTKQPSAPSTQGCNMGLSTLSSTGHSSHMAATWGNPHSAACSAQAATQQGALSTQAATGGTKHSALSFGRMQYTGHRQHGALSTEHSKVGQTTYPGG